MIEPGQTVGIVVRDVELKQHKVIRRFDKFRPNPNPDAAPNQESSQSETPPAKLPVSKDPPSNPLAKSARNRYRWNQRLMNGHSARRSGLRRRVGKLAAVRFREPVFPSRHRTRRRHRKRGIFLNRGRALAGGLALGTLRTRSSRDADSQMMQFSKTAISPAARLRRRLRK